MPIAPGILPKPLTPSLEKGEKKKTKTCTFEKKPPLLT